MTVTKENFVDLYEKYEKVMKLIEEESKTDSLGEPYLSKYSVKQILIGMKANVENLIKNQLPESPEHLQLTAILGFIHLYLGIISIDTEELSVGETHLQKCEETIKSFVAKPEFILIALRLYNQFGILFAEHDTEKARTYLKESEELFKGFKDLNTVPIEMEEIFKNERNENSNAWRNLEKLHTLTLYYLAQIYGSLKDPYKSAVYCHMTLQRQYEQDDYELIDWSLNAATLSQFFMGKGGFKQARHHLAASTFMLDECKKSLDAATDRDESYEVKVENYKHRRADVARCWMKYGISLLSKSKERLLAHTENIDEKCRLSTDMTKLELPEDSTISPDDLQHLDFNGLDVSMYESQITDQFILTLSDAKKVFSNMQNWSTIAHEYYSLDSLASDYIEIVLDQSQLYLLLLFFEDNPDNQAKLHKRRIDMLENVLNSVNSQYYMQYCRQIWYELGQCYEDILDIKLEKIRECNTRPKPHALNKVNTLVEKGIWSYQCFVDSFKEKATGELPVKVPSDVEKPFLEAAFHISALYGKYITFDKNAQLQNIELQYTNYKLVTDYCDKHPKCKDLIPGVIGICKDMVMLLPLKIAKLKQSVID